MKHPSNGAAAVAIMALVGVWLAGPAAAQTPLSPSGAVNNSQPPSISFPNTSPGGPSAPSAGAASRPAAEPATPARNPAPGEPAAVEKAGNPASGAPSAAPAEPATGRAAATTEVRETSTVVRSPSRPKRPAQGGEARPSRSAEKRESGAPGDNVADTLNARELSRMGGGAGPPPFPRPGGPPPRFAPPPYAGPGYGPPPGYGGPPPYPPAMMRAPY